MQVAVKTPRTEIKIKGEIPDRILAVLKAEYGDQLVIEKSDDEFINVFETTWYKATKAGMTPGGVMRIYRELHGLTQKDLGEKLGGIPRQHISNMERGLRPISMTTAKKLAKLFSVPADRFLDLN
jgi:DNA-binding XRE family transcriptional regulator